MKKHIFIINGCGGVGKDTFVKLVSDHLNDKMKKSHTVMNFSSIDNVVRAAEFLGYNHIMKG